MGLMVGLWCLASVADDSQAETDEQEVAEEEVTEEAVTEEETDIVEGHLPDEGVVPLELITIAREVRHAPLGERMRAVSEPLMGRPYLEGGTGEGVAPDDDPPVRYDVFDCLTLVEEVLALTLGPDPSSAPTIRNALRYADGEPTYSARNHFMLQEWVPHNLENGLLKDITAEVGETHLVRKEVDADTWRKWRRRGLFALADDRLPTGTFQLQVLSLGAAAEALDRIPDGALLLTVRQSRSGVPIVVTHLGFKIPSTPEIPLMRHATKMGEEPRVRDDRLRWYVEHLRWYANWPVEGITVLMPQELRPRLPPTVIPSDAGETP